MSGSPETVVERLPERAGPDPTAIRMLRTIEEFAACVRLQRAAFQWSDLDLMPVRLFVLHQHLGGLVLGAYEDGALVGFVNSIVGVRGGETYWHSHMMAVLPAFQNRGIGTALKQAQRACARTRGVRVIQWFFDPLQPRTAYFNLVKLGAIGGQYSINHYGPSTAPVDVGHERDRILAVWRLGGAPPRFGCETRRIRIPADFHRLRSESPAAARHVQLAVRAAFVEHLADGFVATGLERGADGWVYVLRRPPGHRTAHGEGRTT